MVQAHSCSAGGPSHISIASVLSSQVVDPARAPGLTLRESKEGEKKKNIELSGRSTYYAGKEPAPKNQVEPAMRDDALHQF